MERAEQQMSARQRSDVESIEKLKANPVFLECIVSLLAAVEDETVDLKLANAAELRLIDERCRMGRESLAAHGRASDLRWRPASRFWSIDATARGG